jgi:hypothetical protein
MLAPGCYSYYPGLARWYNSRALTGTIRHPGNIKTSGKYIIGLIQSFSLQEVMGR